VTDGGETTADGEHVSTSLTVVNHVQRTPGRKAVVEVVGGRVNESVVLCNAHSGTHKSEPTNTTR
jgi:hypothetical protein